MGISSVHAQKFYEEVAENKIAFTVRDEGGYIAPKTSEGKRSMPFWSSKNRVKKIIENVPAYKDFWIVELNFRDFKRWCATLKRERQLVGMNWSGKLARGYDMRPNEVLRAIRFRIKKKSWISYLFSYVP